MPSRVKRRRRQVRSNGVRTSRREIAQIPSCNHGISVVRVLIDPETIRRLVGWIAGEVFCKVVKVLYSTAQYSTFLAVANHHPANTQRPRDRTRLR